MTMVAVGRLHWPTPYAGQGYGTSGLASGSLTFDSATDRIAWVGRSPVTDSIASVQFGTNTVTTGNTMQIQIETVTNGRPSGVAWAANTNGTVVIADADDSTMKTVTLTAAASLNAGDEFAIVMTSSAGSPTLNIAQVLVGIANAAGCGLYPLVLQDTGAGTWAAPASGAMALCWIVTMTSAGPIELPGLVPYRAAAVATAFNSGSSPNEIALKITAPFKARAIGLRVYLLNIAAGADFTVSLWPASSSVDGDALAQRSEDGDFAYATTNDGYVDLFFATPVTLTAGTAYYIGVRPDTANSLAIGNRVTVSATTMTAFGIPSGALQATRVWTAGTAGVWTETATSTLPAFNFIIDQVDDGAGTGTAPVLMGQVSM